jgi:hypothetical protein
MATLHHPVAAVKLHEQRRVARRMRRIGLGAFFASVTVNAALGIYAVLAPEFGETQGKILATSLCATGAALLALSCEPAWERRLLGPVPYLGAVLGTTGFGLTIAGIWAEPENEAFGQTTTSIMAVAVACALASLLALARLAPGHRWVLTLTLALLALGAALVAIAPWLGDDPAEWYLRAMGVSLIALAAFTVSVPVLHWVDRRAVAVPASAGAIRYCPYCGGTISGEAGTPLLCGRCERAFTVAAGPEEPGAP